MKPTPFEPDQAADVEALPGSLRWQLRALRQDAEPGHDLWPQIAARLERPATPALPRRRWMPPVALAASLLVAIGAVGVWGGFGVGSTPERTASPLLREADGMTRQFDAAYGELTAVAQTTSVQPALDELDRNTRLILDALAQNPDSRLLLEQLRRTHAHRLALVQRATYS